LTNDENLNASDKPITLKTRDVKRLLTNVDKLKIDPYIRERMGEPTPIQYAVEIYQIVDKPRTTDVQKISDDRRRFSAWMIFDIKK
jgi:hypothetical protein